MLWAGCDTLPVLKDDGKPAGIVRRDVLLQRAAGTP
jgi:osmoprotectant transport system ATP-binding protein